MYKYNFLFVGFIIAILGCSKSDTESQLLHKKNPIGLYGDPVSDSKVFQVDSLLLYSQNNIGKKVVLEGKINDVCPMRGCWIDVSDQEKKTNIRVKVVDGEIVFPLSAKGKNVIAEGILSKLEFTEKQAVNWKVHLAQEKGIKLDPKDVALSADDYYEYRINCSGAIIN